MTTDDPNHAGGAPRLRDPHEVMRLARMGSFHQSRLSFMRILLRRLRAEAWRFERPLFDIDARGVGRAIYAMHGPRRSYALVAFGHDLPPEARSDRVIATRWDATFALFDGVPGKADLDRLGTQVPLQEAGRISARELTLSRANRSVRLFEHVVAQLAQGAQPDPKMVADVGYLMRTTAVYGSGKFGAADYAAIAGRPEFSAPFQAEMLSVFLIRAFTLDLVEHMAAQRAPERAVKIEPALRRSFGVGNSTGLGMAPFLINHPALLHSWIVAREEALARVRAVEDAQPAETACFLRMLACAERSVAHWHSEHPAQHAKLASLRADLKVLRARLSAEPPCGARPWDALWHWAQSALSLEGQELLVSLLMEPYGALVDPLAERMSADESATFRIDGTMRIGTFRAILREIYPWALAIDWHDPQAQARAWYVSEEKLEPRLGERAEEPIAAYEQPLAPGRDAAALYTALEDQPDAALLAGFLLAHPEHRHTARRAQLAAQMPYAEIRDNTIAADMLPIDLLRAKLSFFGAGHFDPRSDRWVRINMYQNAPFPHELGARDWSRWIYPQDGFQGQGG